MDSEAMMAVGSIYFIIVIILVLLSLLSSFFMRARGNNECLLLSSMECIVTMYGGVCVCDNKELLFSPSFFLHIMCYMLHLLTTEIEFPFVVTTLLAPDA
jgi:hypothetical protein